MLLLEAGEVTGRVEHILAMVNYRCRAARMIRVVNLARLHRPRKVALAPQYETMFAAQSTDALLRGVEALVLHDRGDFATAEILLPQLLDAFEIFRLIFWFGCLPASWEAPFLELAVEGLGATRCQ